jgi:HlyD family secretion protein
MKKKVVLILAIVVIAGAVLGWTLIRNGKNHEVKYRTEAITKGDIEALVVTAGTLNPIEIVDVGSQVSGKIIKLGADFNSQVSQGQIVAELDQEPLRMKIDQNEANYRSRVASLERAKVTLQTQEKKFERSKALFEKNLISFEEMETAEVAFLNAKSDLITAEASLEQAKSTLELSKVDLSYAIIRSPVDGVVISRKVNVGQTVQASMQAPVLFQMATDLTKMKVECSVDEADIGKVKEGQVARFTVEAFPNENFTGVVRQVRFSPETVQNVVTYTTVVDVENPGKKLLPGMTATVSIIVGEAKGVLKVPNGAMRFTPNLSPEELRKIAEAMMAQRQPQAGQGGAEGAAPKTAAQRPDGGQRGGGQAGRTMSFQGSSGGQTGQRRQQMPRVWMLGEDGKLKMMFIRTGVTDNAYSEITRGELKEGDLVIIGTETPQSGSSASAQQRGGPGMNRMMFIGR